MRAIFYYLYWKKWGCFPLWIFFEPDAWAAAVFVDEFDAGFSRKDIDEIGGGAIKGSMPNKETPRVSENELSTGGGNIRHNAIDGGRAIVKDYLRPGSRPLTPSCFQYGDRPLGFWLLLLGQNVTLWLRQA
jgi:hypothetical protein